MRSRPLPILTLLAALTGCGGGIELSAVWSDDGEYRGILAREYDVTASGFGARRDYQRWWVLSEDDATGGRQQVGAIVEGSVSAQPFYFMRRAGYFLVFDSDATRALQVRSEGTVRALPMSTTTEGCPTVEVIPSPSGALIARVTTRRLACVEHVATASAAVDLEVFDAATLELAAEPAHLVLPAAPAATWTPDETLVVSARVGLDGCLDAWAFSPGTAPVRTEPPGCTYPPTTSSPISADGTILGVIHDDELVESPASATLAFGCQTRAAHVPACHPVIRP